jgi:short-subunit dehydrogenase
VRVFVPILLEQAEQAHIVNTASMAGLTSSAFMGAYNVSKHAVVTLSETLKRELTMFGGMVGVSVLCPGWVNTGIGESARNRPAELSGPGGVDLANLGGGALKGVLEAGLAPDTVAELVLDAVTNDRFYILTHPEWKDMIRTRMEDILEDRTPGSVSFPM